MKAESFEQIKNRMIKKAANIWGVPVNEIETSFDPLVSLLISACASEILKIEGKLNESQNRVTEKLVQLMTPETIVGAKPAHAILYANAIDNEVIVKPEYLFSYKKKNVQKSTQIVLKDIYFSPVQDFKLSNARVQYLLTKNKLIEFNDKKEKKHYDVETLEMSSSSIYLGIKSPTGNLNVNDISFYFELDDIDNKELFYHHLKYAKCYINTEPINVIKGFSNESEQDEVHLNSIFNDTSIMTNTIENSVLKFYEKNYLTFKVSKEKLFNSLVPNEISGTIENSAIDVENVLWIKIDFSSVINPAILEKLFCSLNAIPVLNRDLQLVTYQIRDYVNIIPIKTEDHFLDIKSITNTDGKQYVVKSKKEDNLAKGAYVLRDNSIGKLDYRGAKEYIMHLIELLKDESASFSFLNNDFLSNNLRELNQQISLLEKKMEKLSGQYVETNYVMLEPYNKKENILIDYWTTNGDAANNIKLGSEIEVYKAIGIHKKGNYLLTTTFGGKNVLSMDERLNAYRRVLLSRDRIVTKEDVKALCYELFNEKLDKVEVRKGYTNEIDVDRGITQCIEVILHLNGDLDFEEREKEFLCTNLQLQLEKKSTNVFPYKIKIVY